MQTFIHNLKQQSLLSVATASITTAVVLFLLSNIFNIILTGTTTTWTGVVPFLLGILPLLVASVIKSVGLATLIGKKSVVHGAFIGAALLFIVTISDVITSTIDKTLPSLLIGLFVIIYGAAQYVLPAAILGYFRKD